MKILLVQPFAHKAGHQPIYTKSLGEALISYGQEVDIITFDGFIINIDKKLGIHAVCDRKTLLSSVLRSISKLLMPFTVDSFFITFLTLNLARKKMKNNDFDAVHVIDSAPFPLAHLLFANRVVMTKAFFDVHFPLELSYLSEYYKLGLDATYHRLYRLSKPKALAWLLSSRIFGSKYAMKLYLKWAQTSKPVFICHTDHNKASYRRSILKNVFVIASGTSTSTDGLTKNQARSKLKIPKHKKVLLCFGVNHRDKNYSIIFEALKLLSPADLDKFTVLFAGKIDHSLTENDPKALVSKYKMSNIQVYDGFISEREVEAFFAASDFVLLSYSKQFTCSSMVLAQAFQFKTPVIASKVGQIGEHVTNHALGITFEPEDAFSLSLSLKSVLKLDDATISQMIDNLANMADKYSWKNTANEHISLYRSKLK